MFWFWKFFASFDSNKKIISHNGISGAENIFHKFVAPYMGIPFLKTKDWGT